MNTRSLDEPLPEFVTTYLETIVDPIVTTLMKLEFQVKDAKEPEKAKELLATMKTQYMAWENARAALVPEIKKLSDAEAVRAMNAVTDKETKMTSTMARLVPLVLGLKGGRRRAKTGRRVRARTTRRGRGRS